jgi:hypothetical protein
MMPNKLPPSTLPDCIIIGAGKSGMTSLYYYLQQHPNVYRSPIKETHFVAYAADMIDQFINYDDSIFPVKDIATYKKFFDGTKNGPVRGESTLQCICGI